MPDKHSKAFPRWFTLPRVFAGMSLTIGLVMLVLTPPFGVPDEPHHFLRAYQISEGQLLPTFHDNRGGAELPRSILLTSKLLKASEWLTQPLSRRQILQSLHVPLDPQRRTYCEFSNTSAYSPVPYLPQAAAILISRSLGLGVIQILYYARLANLLLWTATGYLALSLAPGIRRPLFLLMLMPMSLYLAASMSADVVGISLAILFSALVWRQIAEPASPKKISSRHACLFILMACGIGLTKFVYVPLTALPLIIPSGDFGGRPRKRLIAFSVIAAALLTSVLWAMQTPGLDMVANGVSKDFYPRLQLQFLQQNPSAWLTLPIQTLRVAWKEQLTSFVGEFGWMQAPISPIACILYCLALLWTCRPNADDQTPRSIWRCVILIPVIVFSSLSALGLTAYLYWNPLASPDIKGLQGRYLIPLAPVVMMLISILWLRLPPRFRARRATWKLEFECALIAAAANICALYAIIIWFYTSKPSPH